MKAEAISLLKILKNTEQFAIPIYQRTYSWTRKECFTLWTDILRTGRTGSTKSHFIGSIVHVEQDVHLAGKPSPLLVIDGQQRLTSMMLLLEALARSLQDREPVCGFSAKKIREYYLLNKLEDDDRRFKLLLTQTDKQSLIELLRQGPTPKLVSARIMENFGLFQKWIQNLGSQVEPLCKGLQKLMVVVVGLTREHDNPQLIYESMNSKGLELTQADLIRNFILMGLESGEQKKLYEQYWRPMELAFGQKSYRTHFDRFMRHYLTMKTGNIPTIRAIYSEFKKYALQEDLTRDKIELLVSNIRVFAGYYCKMELDRETDVELKAAFSDLHELTVDVAYPFLLELYHDRVKGVLSTQHFVKSVRCVEAYVFRRAVCDIPPNSLNKIFSTLARTLTKDRYLESLEERLLEYDSYRRFPSDQEFKRSLVERDLYNFPRCRYYLQRLENDHNKEPVVARILTIEHILPQNKNLSPAWQKELGLEWQRIQETWVHTLGNLTLTGYNSEYSDRPFIKKRDMEGGFKDSRLKLNEDLGKASAWNERSIQERADRLVIQALKVWSRPNLAGDNSEFGVLDIDHHFPEKHPMRPLFKEFSKQVLALDPCVSAKVLKLYFAFKAKTNFVDVVPQKKRLVLSLNMQFQELHDPRGIARDITGLGRWGNGNAEVSLSDTEDLPYVMGLVQQSLEMQIQSPVVKD